MCFVEELLSKLPAIRCGAEDLVGMTKARYMSRLTWLKELVRFNASNWADRKTFERISSALEMLRLDDSNGSIRAQPYCILLTGYPGCGKSNFALQIAAACLKAKYGKAYPSNIVVLNETDEFQSEFRTSHKVVIFDDVGAESPNFSTINPWRKVIDFVNNIRKTSLNPNVEMKGNVYIEPELVILTTNLKRTMHISHYLVAPSAIYRRLKKIVHLEKNFNEAQIVPVMDYGAAGALVNTNHEEPSQVYDGIVQREALLRKIVEEYLQHSEDQAVFVHETNSNLDSVETRNLWLSIYDDMVYPYIPKKIPLSYHMEKQLPFYHRWYRSLCVEEKDMAICMSGIDFIDLQDASSFEPQSGIENDILSFNEDLIDFLLQRIDWEFFALVRPRMRDEIFDIFEGRIFGELGVYSWKHPFNQYPYAESIGVRCRMVDLDEAHTRYKLLVHDDSESQEHKDPTINPTLIWHHTYLQSKEKLVVSALEDKIDWMNEELNSSGLGCLKNQDSMSIVQYLLAIRAYKRSLKCLGVEYPIAGYTPDVVLKSGNVHVVIECKNGPTSPGKKQLKNYMKAMKENDMESIGVLLSQRDIKIFTMSDVSVSLICNVKRLVNDVYHELSKNSKKFGTTHFHNIDCSGAVEPSSEICSSVERKLSL
jgi:hypothetical protein